MKIIQIVCFALVLAVCERAEPTVWWVSQSGGSTGNCSSASTPNAGADPGVYLREIVDAVNCIGGNPRAGAGHTIRVKTGNYHSFGEPTSVWPSGASWSQPFILESAPNADVVISNLGYCCRMFDVSQGRESFEGGPFYYSYPWYNIWRGTPGHPLRWSGKDNNNGTALMRFDGGVGWLFEDVNFEADGGFINNIVNTGGEDFTFRRTKIGGSQVPGTYAMYMGATRNSLVEFSEIYDSASYCVHAYTGGGAGGNPTNLTYRYNVFRNCGLGETWGGAESSAILIDGPNGIIHNNVFIGGGYTATSSWSSTDNLQIYNNSFYGMQRGGIGLSGATSGTVTARNNVIWGTASGEAVTFGDGFFPGNLIGDHNICPSGGNAICTINGQNPLFVSPPSSFIDSQGRTVFTSTGNFQLQANSPAINQGLNLASVGVPTAVGTQDAAGTTRPQGAAWDLGACEWFSGAGQCPTFTVTPPKPVPSILITSPNAFGRYITNTATQTASGTADCAGGTFTGIAWENNQGGKGAATGTTSWQTTSMTLTPYQVNRISVTLTCSTGQASAMTDIAYNPAELIGAYAMDANSGTAVADTSGKGNNGTMNGAVAWTTTKRRYGTSGLDFSGGSVNIPQNGNNNKIVGGFSVVVSGVNPDAVYSNFRALLVNNYALYIYATTSGGAAMEGGGSCPASVVFAGFSDGTANHILCAASTAPLSIGQNTCVAVTYDGTALKIYQDKTQVASANMTQQLPKPPDADPQGIWQVGNSRFNEGMDGGFDELRIYNHGITAAQVATDCDTPIGVGTPAPPSGLKVGSVPIRIGDQDVKIGF